MWQISLQMHRRVCPVWINLAVNTSTLKWWFMVHDFPVYFNSAHIDNKTWLTSHARVEVHRTCGENDSGSNCAVIFPSRTQTWFPARTLHHLDLMIIPTRPPFSIVHFEWAPGVEDVFIIGRKEKEVRMIHLKSDWPRMSQSVNTKKDNCLFESRRVPRVQSWQGSTFHFPSLRV